MLDARTRRPPHRTQEERSSATRRRILDATVACLASRGYAGTTTLEVAERAGVSRGAQLHHFPTRAALVSAAVTHLFSELRHEYEASFEGLPPGAGRVGAAIDLLWDLFQDERLAAVLDLYVAARTDPELRAEIGPVAAAHHAHVLRLAHACFPQLAADQPRFDEILDLVLDALQGMAVRRLLQPDDPRTGRTLAHIKTLAAAALATSPSPEGNAR